MAKDPAVLWYTQDFLQGTSLFSPAQVGHYARLLCYQQQSKSGSLSVEEIEKIMGKDFKKDWPQVEKKFSKDSNGFFNERMRFENERRKKYSESRRSNRRHENHMKEDMNNHMSSHMETETVIETVLEDRGTGKGWNTKPGESEINLLLPTIKRGAVIELFKISKHTDVSVEQVESLWSIFKAQHFTGQKFYKSENEVYSHFINWCKTQKIEKINGTHRQTSRNSKTAGNEQLVASLTKNLSALAGRTQDG